MYFQTHDYCKILCNNVLSSCSNTISEKQFLSVMLHSCIPVHYYYCSICNYVAYLPWMIIWKIFNPISTTECYTCKKNHALESCLLLHSLYQHEWELSLEINWLQHSLLSGRSQSKVTQPGFHVKRWTRSYGLWLSA